MSSGLLAYLDSIRARDPAPHSRAEIMLYPGVWALGYHRIAHRLYKAKLYFLARCVNHWSRFTTAIDIHPGATIGRNFFIDHGFVVIGETAIIGHRVRIYQAVTLGAKRFPAGLDGVLKKGLARHPVVEDDVVIYAGATVLGRITLGKGASIGGNVWLTHSVPAGAVVTQAKASEDIWSDGAGI